VVLEKGPLNGCVNGCSALQLVSVVKFAAESMTENSAPLEKCKMMPIALYYTDSNCSICALVKANRIMPHRNTMSEYWSYDRAVIMKQLVTGKSYCY